MGLSSAFRSAPVSPVRRAAVFSSKGKMKTFHAAVITASLLCGCVSPPATKITGTVDGVPFSINSPKQVDMTGFKLHADKNAGTFDLTIDRIGSTNSSDVIQTTGAAQVAQINAVGNAISQAAQAAGQAFASGGATLALQQAVKAASPSSPVIPSVTATNK